MSVTDCDGVVEGGEGSYTVVLTSEPEGSVTVTPSSDAETVATVSGALTFTADNWSTAQTVTVSGVDNDVAGGNGSATLSHAVSGYGTVSSADDVTVSVTDDDRAGVTVSESDLTVVEGGEGSYTVVLTSKPEGSVTVTPSSDAETVATVSGALTFTADNWSTAQTVTVSGVDNNVDGGAGTTQVSHTVAGYGEVTADSVSVTVTDDDTAGVTVSPGSVEVTEGGSAEYTVVLTSEPTASVTVSVSGATGDVSVSGVPLTFSVSNWNEEQTVTVSADEDLDAVRDADVTLTHAATGGGYGAVSIGSVKVSVTENDTAGVTVSESDLTVVEGGEGSYTVVLTSEPEGSVTVTPSSDAGTVVTVSGALTFSADNWSTVQTVTVRGVDNDVDVTDARATVSHAVTGYGAVVVASVSVEVTDDDTAGVAVSETALTVAEGGEGFYTVKLDSEPVGSVTVAPESGDTEVATVSGALTFTTGNWSVAQTVTVSGVNNDVDGDAGTTQVSHAVTGYGAVVVDSVSVEVTDDDTAGVTLSKTELTIDEGAEATYTVRLASEPLGNVTVSLASDDESVATVSPSALTFSAGAWSAAQTVTVSGVEDEDADDDTATVSHAVAGYGSVSADEVSVQVVDNNTAGVIVSRAELTVGERETGTYTMVLMSRPSGSVTVTPRSSDSAVATVSSALRFTLENWSTAQTVTVSGGEDIGATRAVVSVSHTVVGYGEVDSAAGVSVAVVERNVVRTAPSGAGLREEENGELTLEEGGTFTYTLRLKSRPTGNVTVRVVPTIGPAGASGSGGGLAPASAVGLAPTVSVGAVVTVSPTELVFTPENWNIAQTVKVTARENEADLGDYQVRLVQEVSGGGLDDESLPAISFMVQNGNIGARWPATLDVSSGSALYTVVLTERPSSNVTMTVSSSSERLMLNGVKTTATTVTFSAASGKTVKTLTVGIVEGSTMLGATLTHQLTQEGRKELRFEVKVRVLEREWFEQSLGEWQTRFARAYSGLALDIIAGRLTGATAGRSNHVSISGSRLPLAGDGSVGPLLRVNVRDQLDPSDGIRIERRSMEDMYDLLSQSSFSLSSSSPSPDGSLLTVWGQGGQTDFDGGSEFGMVDGRVTVFGVGVDMVKEDLLGGFAYFRSSGKGSYQGQGSSALGYDVKVSGMNSIHPYLRLTLRDGVDVWGLFGYGSGKLQTTGASGNRVLDDSGRIKLRTMAAGVRSEIYSVNGQELAVKGDIMNARVKSELSQVRVSSSVNRVRGLLEWRYDQVWRSGGVLSPALEGGLRRDGGDDGTGSSIVFGISLRYEGRGGRWSWEFGGRSLKDRSSVSHRERNIYGRLDYRAGADEYGASLSVESSRGGLTGTAEQAWNEVRVNGLSSESLSSDSGELLIKYGYGMPLGAGLIRPNVSLSLPNGGDASKQYEAGIDYQIGTEIQLNFKVTHQSETANGTGVKVGGGVALVRQR